MNSKVLQAVIEAYGLSVSRILPMQSGYRNKNYPIELTDGTNLNIIFYKREQDTLRTVRNARAIGEFLQDCSYPARYSYDQRILRVTSGPQPQYAGVYWYLSGETIPWDAYSMKHLKALGCAMSNMHAYLKHMPTDNLLPAPQGLRALGDRMAHYFGSADVREALQRKTNTHIDQQLFDVFRRTLSTAEHLPCQQVLHLDFVRSNILFEPGTAIVSGVLDFEKAAIGHPVLDIARTLAFLMVDCKYKTEADIRKYFLDSGYNKHGIAVYSPLVVKRGSYRIDMLESMVDFFLFYDFYKFLRHNPYESLLSNEHFVRTRDILVRRGIIFANHDSSSVARGVKLLQR